jgi:hypothetical protein
VDRAEIQGPPDPFAGSHISILAGSKGPSYMRIVRSEWMRRLCPARILGNCGASSNHFHLLNNHPRKSKEGSSDRVRQSRQSWQIVTPSQIVYLVAVLLAGWYKAFASLGHGIRIQFAEAIRYPEWVCLPEGEAARCRMNKRSPARPRTPLTQCGSSLLVPMASKAKPL